MKTFIELLEDDNYSTYSEILLEMARQGFTEAKNQESREKLRKIIVKLKNLVILEKQQVRRDYDN